MKTIDCGLFVDAASRFLWKNALLQEQDIPNIAHYLNPKMPGGGQGDPLPCGFSKNVSSKESVKPWFFATFNIILKNIFAEKFIEFPQVVQKI